MEDRIHLPDDTLPNFNYLDKLSKIKAEDIEEAIKGWKKKHKNEDLENILESEVIGDG